MEATIAMEDFRRVVGDGLVVALNLRCMGGGGGEEGG